MELPNRVHYGPVIAAILAEERRAPLGPGVPNRCTEGRLAALAPADLFVPLPIRDELAASACLAGLWLYHDFLDESHAVSQSIADAAGSFWHAIMHRREGDFSNSKYWFRRVGAHPVFADLGAFAASQFAASSDSRLASLATAPAWDPFAFVDLCQRALGAGTPLEDAARRLQEREWWLLFDHCHRRARGP